MELEMQKRIVRKRDNRAQVNKKKEEGARASLFKSFFAIKEHTKLLSSSSSLYSVCCPRVYLSCIAF